MNIPLCVRRGAKQDRGWCGGLLAEYDESGTLVTRYVYATHAHVPDFMIQGTTVYRLITDHLGSVRMVVNVDASTASAAQRIDYDAWGNVTNTPATFDQPWWDRDTGWCTLGRPIMPRGLDGGCRRIRFNSRRSEYSL